jgi:hypothetical protein
MSAATDQLLIWRCKCFTTEASLYWNHLPRKTRRPAGRGRSETMDIRGRTAIVTGGGTGIGAAIAADLSDAGARVLIAGRREKPLADAEKRFGPVDVLVNNAGIKCHGRRIEEHSVGRLGPREGHQRACLLSALLRRPAGDGSEKGRVHPHDKLKIRGSTISGIKPWRHGPDG